MTAICMTIRRLPYNIATSIRQQAEVCGWVSTLHNTPHRTWFSICLMSNHQNCWGVKRLLKDLKCKCRHLYEGRPLQWNERCVGQWCTRLQLPMVAIPSIILDVVTVVMPLPSVTRNVNCLEELTTQQLLRIRYIFHIYYDLLPELGRADHYML
jgi:hypothetical protein